MTALGITARSSYMERKGSMAMPHLLDGGGGLRAATETVQTMLVDLGELIIADRTHAEILRMNNDQRYRWYKKLMAEEKNEAMTLVKLDWIAKMSGENSRTKRPEAKAKMSQSAKKRWEDPERRASMSGENHPNWQNGTRMSEMAKKQWEDPEYRASMSGENHHMKRPEARRKFSQWAKKQWEDPEYRASMSGESSPNWRGGTSYLPYCSKFNEQLKESIRNHDNRVCVLCGKGEIQNGKRLSVHHIDGNKMMGCNGIPWYLCALCHSCHSKPDTVEKEFLIVTGGHGG